MIGEISIGLWNVQWASIGSARGRFFASRFVEIDTEVLCVTEGHADLFPDEGYTAMSEENYGYPITPGRRKVLLWSRNPWSGVDVVGSPLLPPGRFVSATTLTSVGPIRFIGVCIPWRDAHVRTGLCNRQAWQDHLTYLEALAVLLHEHDRSIPTVLLGDFNQRIPRTKQPEAVWTALTSALAPDFQAVTSGSIPGAPEPSIDHLAVTPEFRAESIRHLSQHNAQGEPMSDHYGLTITLKPAIVRAYCF